MIKIFKKKENQEKQREYLILAAKINPSEYNKELTQFLVEYKTFWEPQIHSFWIHAINIKHLSFSSSSSSNLTSQIITLFLVSKFRSFSCSSVVKDTFVKGLTLKIIQFLCHFSL